MEYSPSQTVGPLHRLVFQHKTVLVWISRMPQFLSGTCSRVGSSWAAISFKAFCSLVVEWGPQASAMYIPVPCIPAWSSMGAGRPAWSRGSYWIAGESITVPGAPLTPPSLPALVPTGLCLYVFSSVHCVTHFCKALSMEHHQFDWQTQPCLSVDLFWSQLCLTQSSSSPLSSERTSCSPMQPKPQCMTLLSTWPSCMHPQPSLPLHASAAQWLVQLAAH